MANLTYEMIYSPFFEHISNQFKYWLPEAILAYCRHLAYCSMYVNLFLLDAPLVSMAFSHTRAVSKLLRVPCKPCHRSAPPHHLIYMINGAIIDLS